jgi:hypothetical protein
MTLAERIARVIASWKFSPGLMSRVAIQQDSPRCSSAMRMVSATFRSSVAKLMKIGSFILAQPAIGAVHAPLSQDISDAASRPHAIRKASAAAGILDYIYERRSVRPRSATRGSPIPAGQETIK